VVEAGGIIKCYLLLIALDILPSYCISPVYYAVEDALSPTSSWIGLESIIILLWCVLGYCYWFCLNF